MVLVRRQVLAAVRESVRLQSEESMQLLAGCLSPLLPSFVCHLLLDLVDSGWGERWVWPGTGAMITTIGASGRVPWRSFSKGRLSLGPRDGLWCFGSFLTYDIWPVTMCTSSPAGYWHVLLSRSRPRYQVEVRLLCCCVDHFMARAMLSAYI